MSYDSYGAFAGKFWKKFGVNMSYQKTPVGTKVICYRHYLQHAMHMNLWGVSDLWHQTFMLLELSIGVIFFYLTVFNSSWLAILL